MNLIIIKLVENLYLIVLKKNKKMVGIIIIFLSKCQEYDSLGNKLNDIFKKF